MLTLITGAPGAGKTAALVSLLTDLAKGRAVYVNGIPDLKIPHQELKEPSDWMGEVPDGSIIVIDEVQRVWRPTGPGQKIAPDIAALETHRHRGLDFYIITQGPKLVHTNVRALVGRHVHLRDIGFLGRWWYEWPECNDQCSQGWKNAPIKKRYKLPKQIFGQYKSATEHIKPVRSFPVMVVVAIAALFGTAGLAYYSYTRVMARNASASASPPVVAPGAAGVPGAAVGVASGAGPAAPAFLDDRIAFIPRMTIKPESAPAYDGLRRVVNMPLVSGAICSKAGCKCITQQGTDAGLTSGDCRAWASNRPFDPYTPPPTAAEVLNRPDGKLPLSGTSTEEAPARPIDVLPYKPGRVGDAVAGASPVKS
jgi:zona occludens toxin